MTRQGIDRGRTAVYRFFDAHDVLLYVGITRTLSARWANHAKTKAWWPLVATKEADWHPTRAQASIEEQRIIEDDGAVYNDTLPPWRVPDLPVELMTPEFERMRAEYREAHERLHAGVRKYLAMGETPSRIARSVDWSREYIAKIRDGKVKS